MLNKDSTLIDEEKFPRLAQMTENFRTNHRFAADIVNRGYALFGEAWATEFEQVVSVLFPNDEAIAAAAKGYATFAMQSMRLQAAFERERQYKVKLTNKLPARCISTIST